MKTPERKNSIVYITGAGPGDSQLLTLKAKEIIEKSDVIAYDNLVSKEILELALFCNPKVKLIYVGKVGSSNEKSLTQEQINKLLLELTSDYKIICRLKGGDPNIFGRGGEEAVFLKKNNVNFEIIPGVSSITAVPAYSGIPLTHREHTSSFTVLSAHEYPGNPENSIKWDDFDAKKSTLVLLMGVKNLPKIAEKLISIGRAKETPVAIIYWGTTNRQLTVSTKLGDILDDLQKYDIKAPSVIVIGDVVNYREILNWFETKTLFGKKVLITRSEEQTFSFASKLLKLGAIPISLPIVKYEMVDKEIYNKAIINNIAAFDWIFFTSQNSVKFFFEILNKNYYDSRALSKTQIAAVGHKTKLELLKYNIKADFVPKRFSFKDLINELSEKINIKEKRILLPTQKDISSEISDLLITRWEIYKALFTETLTKEKINEISEGIDIMTFFSSNSALNFLELINKYNLKDNLKNTLIATIGQETANTTKEIFGKVDIIAEPYTEEGLIEQIERFFLEKSKVLSTNIS